jgi:predicted dehydrogenase
MAALVARAAGCEVAAFEPDAWRLELCRKMGFVAAEPGQAIELTPIFTEGKGFDAVIIAADTPSSQPVELAASIARSRATIVAAGAVGEDLPRKPYYEKELFFVNSRSYGPGRYDAQYEEQGIDYPIDYVRWTEGRNLAAFIRLLEKRAIDVHPLITHRFTLEQAAQAYALISKKDSEPFLAVLFEYPDQDQEPISTIQLPRLQNPAKRSEAPLRVGVIGAGNFASLVMLPLLKRINGVELRGIASASGLSAQHLGKKYHFHYVTSEAVQVLEDKEIDLILILTRHHLHAQQTTAALRAGKHVFCEKPLAICEADLNLIQEALGLTAEQGGSSQTAKEIPLLMVGFNRRFAPFIQKLKKFMTPRHQPAMIHYRINAGYIPRSHWVQDAHQGGGRLIGEVCHFVDTMVYLLDALPDKVWVKSLPDEQWYCEDNLVLNFNFPDGSIGVITYLANGDKAFPKERLEVFWGGKVAVMDDFRRLELVHNGERHIERSWLRQDKGHAAELRAFLRSITQSGTPPISYQHLLGVSQATLTAQQALHSGKEETIPYPSIR